MGTQTWLPKQTSSVMLYDNKPVLQWLQEMNHPPFSPDLAPNDYFLFRYLYACTMVFKQITTASSLEEQGLSLHPSGWNIVTCSKVE